MQTWHCGRAKQLSQLSSITETERSLPTVASVTGLTGEVPSFGEVGDTLGITNGSEMSLDNDKNDTGVDEDIDIFVGFGAWSKFECCLLFLGKTKYGRKDSGRRYFYAAIVGIFIPLWMCTSVRCGSYLGKLRRQTPKGPTG